MSTHNIGFGVVFLKDFSHFEITSLPLNWICDNNHHHQCFRKNHTQTSCILCGKDKLIYYKDHQNLDYCICPSSINCGACKEDLAARLSSSEKKFGIHYKCSIHGKYRHYEDGLMRYKVSAIKYCHEILFVCFRLFIVATCCLTERRSQKTVSCYGR